MSEKGRPRAILPLAVVMASLATLSPTTPSAAILPQIAVRTTPAGEFQPARNQSAFAWEQNSRARPKKYDVMVQPAAGPIAQANSGESSAAMGDFAGDRLVFQQYRGNPYGRGRSDLFFHDLLSGARSRVRGVNTGRWEYWPSASGEWLLFGRWTPTSEVRRLFLNNLDSGEARLLEKTKGKNAFIAPGQVNGNFAVWSVCRRRCDVIRYNIADKSHSVIKGGGPYDRAPSVAPDGTVYFSRGGKRCGVSVTLVRDPLQGPQQVLVELQKGLDIRDTYAFLESNGTVEIYYERNVCGRPAASDIYKVRELALAGLSVQLAGTGSGIVSSSPPGINCGTDCAEDLERGTKVTLMPGAGSGSAFVGWSGACTGSGPCQLTMDAAKHVTATFHPVHTLTIVEDSIPDDPQMFEFTLLGLGPSLTFPLNDDGVGSPLNNATIGPLPPKTYQVDESIVAGWNLTGINCLDPDGGSSVSLGNRRATIDLDTNEAVQCTFTNTR